MLEQVGLDKLIIRELKLPARLAWYDSERESQQTIVIDVELFFSIQRAAQSKNLNDSICYMSLRDALKTTVNSRKWILVEELTEALCESALNFAAPALEVKIQVRKFVAGDIQFAGIEAHRRKPE